MSRKGPKDWVPGQPLSPGYKELPEVNEAIQDGDLGIDALWKAAGAADFERVTQVLLDAGYDLEGAVRDIRLIATPDDLLGERYRVWLKF
jgi:hypothetical protein